MLGRMRRGIRTRRIPRNEERRGTADEARDATLRARRRCRSRRRCHPRRLLSLDGSQSLGCSDRSDFQASLPAGSGSLHDGFNPSHGSIQPMVRVHPRGSLPQGFLRSWVWNFGRPDRAWNRWALRVELPYERGLDFSGWDGSGALGFLNQRDLASARLILGGLQEGRIVLSQRPVDGAAIHPPFDGRSGRQGLASARVEEPETERRAHDPAD